MAAIVTPLLDAAVGTPPVDHDGTSGELPLRFRVTGLAQGEDPTVQVGIPQRFSTVTIGTVTYGVDRIRVERVLVDGAVDVECMCSTDGRFRFRVQNPPPGANTKEWGLTFQQGIIRAPFFVREPREYYLANSDGTTLPVGQLVWVNKPMELEIDYAILTRTCYFFGLDDLDMREINGQVMYAMGDLHIFTLSVPALITNWRYMAPTVIMRVQPDVAAGGSMEVTYTWKGDPGNGPVGVRSGNPNQPGATLATRGRPAFYRYEVAGAPTTGTPTVILVDEYPALDYDDNGNPFANPWRNPLGWQTLPGNPLG